MAAEAKEPTATEVKIAKRWMLRERDIRAILSKNLIEAETALANMCVTSHSLGGVIDTYYGEDLLQYASWKRRREDDKAEADELAKWFPDWSEVHTLKNRKLYASTSITEEQIA